MATGGRTDPQLLENAQELSSEIQTILSHQYSPITTDPGKQDMSSHKRQGYDQESGYKTNSTGAQMGGARPKTTTRQPREEVQRKVEGVVTSTPGPACPHRQTARARSSSPAISSSRQNRPGLFPEDTVRNMVHSYLEDVSRNIGRGYAVPPVSLPKFSLGGDWKCFLSEFRDMVQLQT